MPIRRYQLRMINLPLRGALTITLHSREYNRRKLQLVDSFRRIKPQARGSHDVSIHRANIRANWSLRGRIQATKVQLSSNSVARKGGRGQSQAKAQRAGCFVNFCQRAGPLPPFERALEDPASLQVRDTSIRAF